MTLAKSNIVLGTGGHSKAILENLYLQKKKNIRLYDIKYSKKNINVILKSKVINDFSNLNKKIIGSKNNLYLALGNNQLRKIYFSRFKKKFLMQNLISKNSYISNFSNIGFANFFNHFSYVGCNSTIGDNNIINTYGLLEHDVKIGSHCHVCPGVKIGGSVIIGDEVFIGIGSVVIDKIQICSNVVIGAGSIITKNINVPGTYVTFKNKLKKI
jgi:sugar O-acyltransferase (sialic acid O-acetyltransferase NeuD family)